MASLPVDIKIINIQEDSSNRDFIFDRFLGQHKEAVYLIRPDQHIAARWPFFDESLIKKAIWTAMGN